MVDLATRLDSTLASKQYKIINLICSKSHGAMVQYFNPKYSIISLIILTMLLTLQLPNIPDTTNSQCEEI